MSEQFLPPNPHALQNFAPPSAHLMGGDQWTSPTMTAQLDKVALDKSNPTFLIDTSAGTNIDVTTIGMHGEALNGQSLEVTAFVGIGFESEGSDEPAYKIPIIKETNNGLDKFTIMGKSEDGKPRAIYTFSREQDVHIGREVRPDFDPKTSAVGISLKDLGIDSEKKDTVSRDHLTIRWTEDGLLVTDHSTNGTKVEAIEKKVPREKQVGGAVASLAGGSVENVPVPRKLIDSVPKSPDDFAKIDAAKSEELNRPVVEQLARVEAEFHAFTEQFTKDQTMNMWKYSAGLQNKREAQIKGDGQASYDHERFAGEGLTALRTPELKQAADKYHRYMQQIRSLRSNLR